MPQRRKPVVKKIAEGSYRPSRHGPRPDEVPNVPGLRPKQPKGLEAAAVPVWKELLALVGARLQAEDAPQLEQAAVWLAQWRLIVSKLAGAEPGTLEYTRTLAAASTASQNFDRIARKLGMTPLDRESLSTPAGTAGGAIRW